jgi:hypothetical protein
MTDKPVIFELIKDCDNPTFIICPSTNMHDDDAVRLFSALEAALDIISKKININFSILIESANGFDGYAALELLAEEQKSEAESRLWK